MYWKLSAESATAWLNRYRDDPFFRTEVNVVILQITFALVIVILVGASFSLLYQDLARAITQGIQAGINSRQPSAFGPAIVQEIEQIRTQNFIVVFSVIVLTTILFGYIIARVTLRPARTALASQKQFIGNIAHELRTPLSVIKTNTEVALLGNSISNDIRSTLESNIEELDRISEIINNLLSLSTLVRPDQVEFSAVDLSMVATNTVQKFQHFADRNSQQIILRKTPDTWVWGNATALQQVIGNLVKNALQYTPRGGSVRITVEPAVNNKIALTVQDSGIGIARKDLFRIFEPFYRGDPSRTRGQGGSGLGLAIVSELVKLHRGKITIRSSIGRGTTVSVLFPGVAGRGVGHEVEHKEALSEIAVDFSSKNS